MNVAILGCGPAGLLAAHAVHEAGEKVSVFSIKQPSPIGGAQFLHREIPGLTSENPDGLVNILHIGSPAVYAAKVYGSEDAPTSWDEYADGHHEIWNMPLSYQKLWLRYSHFITDVAVERLLLRTLVDTYDVILSCIPAKSICVMQDEHEFVSQPVWITPTASFENSVENLIIYNGSENTSWYRSSRIFGHGGTEWPHHVEGSVRIHKPLHTDCDCWPEVERLGRYGAWQKGLLIHHAYEEAMAIMEGKRALFSM